MCTWLVTGSLLKLLAPSRRESCNVVLYPLTSVAPTCGHHHVGLLVRQLDCRDGGGWKSRHNRIEAVGRVFAGHSSIRSMSGGACYFKQRRINKTSLFESGPSSWQLQKHRCGGHSHHSSLYWSSTGHKQLIQMFLRPLPFQNIEVRTAQYTEWEL